MYKGWYNSVSGMLTQQRVLNTIGNNLSNASTAGFKKDVTTSITFNDVMAGRYGNVDKSNPADLGASLSSIRTVDERVTVYTQGGMNTTGRNFDFAIAGDGFFEIEAEGGNVYTRNGQFTVDEDGFLFLQGGGRVMGVNGAIYLGTDRFSVSPDGTITLDANGNVAGQVRVVDFADYETVSKNELGFFESTAAGATVNNEVTIYSGVLETSNVNAASEMSSMIEAQRAFQSASQVFRIYDSINERSENIARL